MDGFSKIATEASETNPATKIVAATIAETLHSMVSDIAVTGTASVDGKSGTINGKLE
ncbi:MAG: hypothetical protein IJB05_04665 [Bacteroidales bacterium]|nr:hypothetical protein [Bacteroidales bacterium]